MQAGRRPTRPTPDSTAAQTSYPRSSASAANQSVGAGAGAGAGDAAWLRARQTGESGSLGWFTGQLASLAVGRPSVIAIDSCIHATTTDPSCLTPACLWQRGRSIARAVSALPGVGVSGSLSFSCSHTRLAAGTSSHCPPAHKHHTPTAVPHIISGTPSSHAVSSCAVRVLDDHISNVQRAPFQPLRSRRLPCPALPCPALPCLALPLEKRARLFVIVTTPARCDTIAGCRCNWRSCPHTDCIADS